MLRLLGQNEYGLYSTVASTISMLSILNLGFSAGYIRYYAKYKNNNELLNIYKLNGLFIIIFTVIGVVALICGVLMTINLELFFNTGLTITEYEKARILMILFTLRMALSFPFSVFLNIITAHERFIFIKICGMASTIFSPLITLAFLLAGYGSIAMVLITVIIGTITDIIYAYYAIVKLNQKFIFRDFNKSVLRDLCSYTAFIAINMIVDQINWNIDKVLLARYQGTASVAIYSIGYSLYNYYMSFSTSISSVFTPSIHTIVNQTRYNMKEQREKLTSLFILVGRVQFLILGLIASGLIFFGKQFIVNFWAGEGYTDSYYVMLLLVLPSSIALIQNLGIEIQRALNRHYFRSFVYFAMAIINLVLSIILCQKYGAIGSAIGTAVSLIIANGLVINIYYHKKCNIDILEFWKNIFIMLRGIIIPVVTGIIINVFFEIDTVSKFIFFVSVYMIVYFVNVWLFSMNDMEKLLVLNPIKKVINKCYKLRKR